jgi:hypothetical protein
MPLMQTQAGEHPPVPHRSPSTLHAVELVKLVIAISQTPHTSLDASAGGKQTPNGPESSGTTTSHKATSKADASEPNASAAFPLSIDASTANTLCETSAASEILGSPGVSAVLPLQPSMTQVTAATADRVTIPMDGRRVSGLSRSPTRPASPECRFKQPQRSCCSVTAWSLEFVPNFDGSVWPVTRDC